MANGNDGIVDALRFAAAQQSDIDANTIIEIDGRKYSRAQLAPVVDPAYPGIEVASLESLIEFVGTLDASKIMIVVQSPTEVVVVSKTPVGTFNRRDKFLTAKAIPSNYRYGNWFEQDEFIISLNTHFVETATRQELLRTVASIAVNAEGGVSDSGVSQTVSVKSGARLLTEKEVPPCWDLQPWCTFREIDQPVRKCLLRLDKSGTLALYDASGGAWEIEAREKIAGYLRGALNETVETGINILF
jgi:hypothetical protein